MKRLVILALAIFMGFATKGFALPYVFQDRFEGQVVGTEEGRTPVMDSYTDPSGYLTSCAYNTCGDLGFYNLDIEHFKDDDFGKQNDFNTLPLNVRFPVYWWLPSDGHDGYSDDGGGSNQGGAGWEHGIGLSEGVLYSNYGQSGYHINGYFGMWAGPDMVDTTGIVIDIINNDISGFRTGYSTQPTNAFGDTYLFIDTYFTDGTTDRKSFGPMPDPQLRPDDKRMGMIAVDAPLDSTIDYILIHGADKSNTLYTTNWVVDDVTGIPEPSTILLLAGGLITFIGYRRFRRN